MSEIDNASEKYYKRNWGNYVPEKFKYWITLSFRAGVMWQKKKSKQEKEELIEKVNEFIRVRLPRVMEYYPEAEDVVIPDMLNEDIRTDLIEYINKD